jgi:hypothetical protein
VKYLVRSMRSMVRWSESSWFSSLLKRQISLRGQKSIPTKLPAEVIVASGRIPTRRIVTSEPGRRSTSYTQVVRLLPSVKSGSFASAGDRPARNVRRFYPSFYDFDPICRLWTAAPGRLPIGDATSYLFALRWAASLPGKVPRVGARPSEEGVQRQLRAESEMSTRVGLRTLLRGVSGFSTPPGRAACT